MMKRAKSGTTLTARLDYYSMPVPECGCHIWTGVMTGNGYGALKVNGKLIGSHRLVWEQENGAIPDGKCVLHRCDTPLCINLDHLFLGTKLDNTHDMITKGRENPPRGESHWGSRLAEADVIAIRAMPGTQRTIAKIFGVRQGAVSKIKSRKRWRHIP